MKRIIFNVKDRWNWLIPICLNAYMLSMGCYQKLFRVHRFHFSIRLLTDSMWSTCRTTLFVVISLCFITLDGLAKGGAAHIMDALGVTLDATAEINPNLWDLMSYISQGMDYGKKTGGEGIADAGSSFLKTIRAEFKAEGYSSLRGLGQHHYYSHWDFNDSIPKDMLFNIHELSAQGKLPPDAVERFILRWRQFVFSRTQAVKQVFNLSGEGADKVAQSFASLVDDIHNFGDWAFDKDVDGLRPVEKIVDNYFRTCNRILGKHNNLVMAIKQEVKNLPKMPAKEYAQAVIKILDSHKGEMSERIYRIFVRYGFNGNIKAIDYAAIVKATAELDTTRSMALAADEVVDDLTRMMPIKRIFKTELISKSYERNVAKVSENIANRLNGALERKLSQDQQLVKSLAAKKCSEIKTTTGILQTIKLENGTTSKVLHIPIENVTKGINAGLSAGVMTFILSEGVTGYCYFKGEISKDKFVLESGKNCAAALSTGSATFVAVTMGATAGGPIVLALGVGSYLLCDIGFTRLERAIEYQKFHIEDMLGVFPIEFQRRRSTLEYDGYENLLQHLSNTSLINFHGTNPSLLEHHGGENSLLEFEHKRKSLLEQ